MSVPRWLAYVRNGKLIVRPWTPEVDADVRQVESVERVIEYPAHDRQAAVAYARERLGGSE